MNKTQKGITLIALIITIIVLLILAVVTISAVNEGSIFAHANNAATRYSQEAERENALIHNLLGTLPGEGTQDNPPDEPVVETSWTYDEGTKTYTKGDLSITADSNGYLSNADVLTALGIENSTGTYTGNWQVIGNSNGKLKLVSVSNVGPNVTLGYQDEVANTAKTTEEYNAMTDSEKMERSIASYQRAVQTLNEAAQTATGITSAESIDLQDIYDIIGEENVDKTANQPDYGKIYNYYYDVAEGKVKSKYSTDGGTTWSPLFTTSCTSETFVNANGEKIVVDSEGDEVTLTYDSIAYALTADQKTAIGSLATGLYWLSTPCVSCNEMYAGFRVRRIGSGNLGADYLFVSSDYGYSWSGRSPCRSFNLSSRTKEKRPKSVEQKK